MKNNFIRKIFYITESMRERLIKLMFIPTIICMCISFVIMLFDSSMRDEVCLFLITPTIIYYVLYGSFAFIVNLYLNVNFYHPYDKTN